MRVVSVVSGKGGVGKSIIAINLAEILSQNGYKVLLVDADLGLGNLDILLNLKPKFTLFDFFKGGVSLNEVVADIKPNLSLLPGFSGEEILEFYSNEMMARLSFELRTLKSFDFVIIDTMSSLHKPTKDIINLSDKTIILATPEPTSIIDTYAMMKVVLKFKNEILLSINLSQNSNIAENLEKILRDNIKSEFSFKLLGEIRKDSAFINCSRLRAFVSDEYPYSLGLYDVRVIASNLLLNFGLEPLEIENLNGINGLIRRVLNLI
ncbi:AAA family ATPase [Campylobacter corcagiensis]|uniref:AAA family ATPase n=1 Tax=Campylobacter corcagiensis TaxID=1448857 RepID=A0A7M1LGD8_9BACT|nr:AAA family ATPase [Campylobacter corcagiensis]QKF64312.1 polar flagellar biogenesis regulatory protein FlhG [Campylobacter corcagiensis]QOQ87500.1 AAA family ATPase [Campylobacter corcagiensis]